MRRTGGNYGELREELGEIKSYVHDLGQKHAETIHFIKTLVSSKINSSPTFPAAPAFSGKQQILNQDDLINSTTRKFHSTQPILLESSRAQTETIQKAVAQYYGLRISDLKSTKRARALALARQVAMYLVRENIGLGFREIGLHFGGKDHTTVLHACQKIRCAIEEDSDIRFTVGAIQQILNNNA